MAEAITGIKSTFFPDLRPQKQDGEKKENFSRWLSPESEANTDAPISPLSFLMPVTSLEDFIVLAQASQEKPTASAALAYETTAQQLPEEGVEDTGQYVFEFVSQDDQPGEVITEEI